MSDLLAATAVAACGSSPALAPADSHPFTITCASSGSVSKSGPRRSAGSSSCVYTLAGGRRFTPTSLLPRSLVTPTAASLADMPGCVRLSS